MNMGVDPSSPDLFSTNVIEDFKNGKGYNWDYFDYAFKPGIQQDYSLSVRGGSNAPVTM